MDFESSLWIPGSLQVRPPYARLAIYQRRGGLSYALFPREIPLLGLSENGCPNEARIAKKHEIGRAHV